MPRPPTSPSGSARGTRRPRSGRATVEAAAWRAGAAATATSSASPTAWPRLSLTRLKWSRSMNATATGARAARPARRRAARRSARGWAARSADRGRPSWRSGASLRRSRPVNWRTSVPAASSVTIGSSHCETSAAAGRSPISASEAAYARHTHAALQRDLARVEEADRVQRRPQVVERVHAARVAGRDQRDADHQRVERDRGLEHPPRIRAGPEHEEGRRARTRRASRRRSAISFA